MPFATTQCRQLVSYTDTQYLALLTTHHELHSAPIVLRELGASVIRDEEVLRESEGLLLDTPNKKKHQEPESMA